MTKHELYNVILITKRAIKNSPVELNDDILVSLVYNQIRNYTQINIDEE